MVLGWELSVTLPSGDPCPWGSLSLGSPWTALQSPSVSPEHGDALVLCLQPAAFPPALEKFQAMANIYLREDFKMEKGGGKGALP